MNAFGLGITCRLLFVRHAIKKVSSPGVQNVAGVYLAITLKEGVEVIRRDEGVSVSAMKSPDLKPEAAASCRQPSGAGLIFNIIIV